MVFPITKRLRKTVTKTDLLNVKEHNETRIYRPFTFSYFAMMPSNLLAKYNIKSACKSNNML